MYKQAYSKKILPEKKKSSLTSYKDQLPQVHHSIPNQSRSPKKILKIKNQKKTKREIKTKSEGKSETDIH